MAATRSLRQTVVNRAAELGYNANQLAAAVPRVSAAQLYRYFAGTSDLSGDRLEHVLRFLGLEVTPVRRRARAR
jgi:hypothetical protein